MKKHLTTICSLSIICAVVAILLAATNHITAPIIKEQENEAAFAALADVFPGGEGFEQIDISEYELPNTITEAYSEKSGGYVFKIETTGYNSGFVIMCGVDANGAVTGATYIASSETLGAEKGYGDTLIGSTKDTIDGVATVSGATKTTGAYKNAAKDAINASVILGGGSVDLRDEAQILNDNLSAALPDGDGKFTSLFITEELDGVSAVYKADNDKGYVFISGENFIATDANGEVISNVDNELKSSISESAKKVIGSKITEIDISKYENMPKQVLKAYKTNSGNFVFELRAAGFGINGDAYYNPSGEYIMIKVSATTEGEIIMCETVSQKESEGIGDACANPEFYSQFNGKEEANYREIDAISGATLTTNGYKTAVSKVFEAIKILKGDG
ncbi:MAG: FMN-binding protein [Clostridia bacterium]|nr:FMN-binding protein [Clostridia bacterium]